MSNEADAPEPPSNQPGRPAGGTLPGAPDDAARAGSGAFKVERPGFLRI
jgi:hypothetical protein